MKTEKDFPQGTEIVYVDSAGKKYNAVVDYSYGDEEEGCVRANKPNGASVYVPIDRIL